MVQIEKLSKFKVGDVHPAVNRKIRNVFIKNVRKADWTFNDGIVCPAGQFTTVALLSVPVNHLKTVGISGVIGNIDNRGIAFGNIKDTTNATIVGEYQLVALNSEQRGADAFNEAFNDYDFLPYDATTKPQFSPVQKIQESDLYVREYGYIALQVKPDAQKTLSAANSTMSIPVTDYELI